MSHVLFYSFDSSHRDHGKSIVFPMGKDCYGTKAQLRRSNPDHQKGSSPIKPEVRKRLSIWLLSKCWWLGFNLLRSQIMITQQESLDKVYTAFIYEKAPWAIDESNSCLYRGKNWQGLECKCAFGTVLPDDKYNSKFEAKLAAVFFNSNLWASVGKVPDLFANAVSDFEPKENNAKFYGSLQRAHDELAREVKSQRLGDDIARTWLEDKLRLIALEFGLEWKFSK
jgi:hypothetical protein